MSAALRLPHASQSARRAPKGAASSRMYSMVWLRITGWASSGIVQTTSTTAEASPGGGLDFGAVTHDVAAAARALADIAHAKPHAEALAG